MKKTINEEQNVYEMENFNIFCTHRFSRRKQTEVKKKKQDKS